MPPSSPGWNYFARTLEALLSARGVRLNHLEHAGVYREEIRRLRRSLLVPNSFPLLTPQQIDRVIDCYQLTPAEVLLLRAAIVVTSIQRTLFKRISADEALAASEEIFPIVVRAMQLNKLSSVRHDDDEDRIAEVEHPLDRLFAFALDAFDRGMLALHTSQLCRFQLERIRSALEAKREFEAARADLDRADSAAQQDATLRFWRQQVQLGLEAVEERVRELGVQ